MTSGTPLSDCIAALTVGETSVRWTRFFDALLAARLGVVIVGDLPAGTHVVGSNEAALATTKTPEGRVMVLACADPPVFARRYPEQPFNGDMDVPSVFRTVLASLDCQGLLINSAISEHSLPIDRAKIKELVAGGKHGESALAKFVAAVRTIFKIP
jgi:hypothetical protein